MLGRAYIFRSIVFCLGLTVCTAAWLAVMADSPSNSNPSSSNPSSSNPPSSNPSPSNEPAAPQNRPAVEPSAPSLPQGIPDVDMPAPKLSTSEEAAINEILQIRREQGGLLDGTLLEELSGQAVSGSGPSPPGQDAEFARALRGVAAAADAEPKPNQPPLASPLNGPSPLPQTVRDDRPDAAGELQLIDLLRLTARRLDSQAADYEDADAYRQANRCRATAKQLRRLARELKAAPAY